MCRHEPEKQPCLLYRRGHTRKLRTTVKRDHDVEVAGATVDSIRFCVAAHGRESLSSCCQSERPSENARGGIAKMETEREIQCHRVNEEIAVHTRPIESRRCLPGDVALVVVKTEN